ncbi:MAG: lipid A hydroxylase LpxO, partial [Pseudomonas sp.]
MKWFVLALVLFSIMFVHFRGRVRLPLLRQLVDHSSIMAPINLFMYAFSRVPAEPFPQVAQYQA